jgi:flagellar protein FlaG
MDISAIYSSAQAAAANPSSLVADKVAENRELIQAVKSLNSSELSHDGELTFQMDRDTRRTVIRIVDRKTNEVIRQVPPEYVLRLAKQIGRNTE